MKPSVWVAAVLALFVPGSANEEVCTEKGCAEAPSGLSSVLLQVKRVVQQEEAKGAQDEADEEGEEVGAAWDPPKSDLLNQHWRRRARRRTRWWAPPGAVVVRSLNFRNPSSTTTISGGRGISGRRRAKACTDGCPYYVGPDTMLGVGKHRFLITQPGRAWKKQGGSGSWEQGAVCAEMLGTDEETGRDESGGARGWSYDLKMSCQATAPKMTTTRWDPRTPTTGRTTTMTPAFLTTLPPIPRLEKWNGKAPDYCGWTIKGGVGENAQCLGLHGGIGREGDRGTACSLEKCPDEEACERECNACRDCAAFEYKPEGGGGFRCHMKKDGGGSAYVDFSDAWHRDGWRLKVNSRSAACRSRLHSPDTTPWHVPIGFGYFSGSYTGDCQDEQLDACAVQYVAKLPNGLHIAGLYDGKFLKMVQFDASGRNIAGTERYCKSDFGKGFVCKPYSMAHMVTIYSSGLGWSKPAPRNAYIFKKGDDFKLESHWKCALRKRVMISNAKDNFHGNLQLAKNNRVRVGHGRRRDGKNRPDVWALESGSDGTVVALNMASRRRHTALQDNPGGVTMKDARGTWERWVMTPEENGKVFFSGLRSEGKQQLGELAEHGHVGMTSATGSWETWRVDLYTHAAEPGKGVSACAEVKYRLVDTGHCGNDTIPLRPPIPHKYKLNGQWLKGKALHDYFMKERGFEHGKGHSSLFDCARLVLEDKRCKGNYFQAEQQPDTRYQCKCSTGTCSPNANVGQRNYKIYAASSPQALRAFSRPIYDDHIRFRADNYMCLDADKRRGWEGAPINLWNCGNHDNQQFIFSGDNTIRARASTYLGKKRAEDGPNPELCLHAPGPLKGDALTLQRCEANANDQFVKHSDGTIRVKSNPELCVNAAGGQFKAMDGVGLDTCKNKTSEAFQHAQGWVCHHYDGSERNVMNGHHCEDWETNKEKQKHTTPGVYFKFAKGSGLCGGCGCCKLDTNKKDSFSSSALNVKVLKCEDNKFVDENGDTHTTNFCSQWCNTDKWGCGINTLPWHDGRNSDKHDYSCNCAGCNGCAEEAEDDVDASQATLVKDGYCGGTRVGLGSDHGVGHKSLEDCAKVALEDDRCHTGGYFDAEEQGGTYQCKCPTAACKTDNPPSSGRWKIYVASKTR